MKDSTNTRPPATRYRGIGLLLLALAGCGDRDKAGQAELPPPMVTVGSPVEQTVTKYEYATGRTEPLEQVEIRARVSGYLNAIHFEQGKEVKKGQLLFEIDPEPSKADLARAKAALANATADLTTAEAEVGRAQARELTTRKDYEREEASFKKGASSETDRDKAKGNFDEAAATVRSNKAKIEVAKAKIEDSKAALRNAELNLSYCSITSPIDGIAGDRLVTVGNLVAGGQGTTTLLTTVVAVEKMDIAFDVDENTLQKLQQSVRDGKIKATTAGVIPAEAGFAVHGTAYPLKGFINFTDNRVDAKTGTVRIKARFDNPKPAVGFRLMSAGMYARVRVPIGDPVKAVLVPDSAFGSDQGIKFLYAVGPENKAVRMDAVTGNLEGDLRVVESVQVAGDGKPRSLAAGDKIIVSGIQRVRPGLTVDPKPAKK